MQYAAVIFIYPKGALSVQGSLQAFGKPRLHGSHFVHKRCASHFVSVLLEDRGLLVPVKGSS